MKIAANVFPSIDGRGWGRVNTGIQITVTVEGKPVSAGIDPYHKLIDRHPEDNETDVDIDTD